jgi:hypothetical protein
MEDILSVYKQDFNPAQPLICMDETSKQLVKEIRRAIPAKAGRPARYDYEYDRIGA